MADKSAEILSTANKIQTNVTGLSEVMNQLLMEDRQKQLFPSNLSQAEKFIIRQIVYKNTKFGEL